MNDENKKMPNKETLTLKELAPYLPYKLKILHWGKEKVMTTGSMSSVNWIGIKAVLNGQGKPEKFIPILRPLSQLTEREKKILYFEIIATDNDMYGSLDEFIDFLDETAIEHLPFCVYNQLVKWHYDMYDLIPRNLAMEIKDPLLRGLAVEKE